LKELLNESQYLAATHGEGPLLIVAGAGSGKTRTLVYRVAHLVSSGVNPREILLLTFTRKAAFEMIKRAEELVGTESGRVRGGTFHANAAYLLRTYAPLLGYPPSFGIMDQADAESLIGRIRDDVTVAPGERLPKKGAILNVISLSRNLEREIPGVLKEYFPHLVEFEDVLKRIALVYQEEKKSSALMDFDDLLVNFGRVLSEHEDARREIVSRFKHVLVDEYQDTNPVQARITRLLAGDRMNVTAVGDEAQSIYAFRGATFKNIMDFPQIFPGAKVLKLEENYRSTNPILSIANHALEGAKESYGKVLRAVRKGGALPVFRVCLDLADEADKVTQKLMELRSAGAPLKDIAVLFRASSHSYELERRLNGLGIVFVKFGGQKFMEASHNKDFAAFLRVAANPRDSVSLNRIFRMIPGVGDVRAGQLIEKIGGDRGVLSAMDPGWFGKKGAVLGEKLSSLFSLICSEDDRMGNRPDLIRDYYLDLLPFLYPDDFPYRENDARDFALSAARAESLSEFLSELTLDPPSGEKAPGKGGEDKDFLTLSTIHSAKGLEWNHVFVLSLVDGRFPSFYSSKTERELEEERRLLYVALTRAKDGLYLMYPEEVVSYDRVFTRPCRFLERLPEGSVELRRGARIVPHHKIFSRPEKKKKDPAPQKADVSASSEFSDDDSGTSFYGTASKSSARPPVRPSGERIREVAKGQIVEHLTFGRGSVLSVKGGRAVIDFDSFGRKNIDWRYASLFQAE
jgi:DNA helicase-2/ATP-dependent DNA helicase PcrA